MLLDAKPSTKSTTRYKVRMRHSLPIAMEPKPWLEMVRRRPPGVAVGAIEVFENELCAVVYIDGGVQAQPLETLGAGFLYRFTPELQAVLTDWVSRYRAGEFNAALEKHRRHMARSEGLAIADSTASSWAF